MKTRAFSAANGSPGTGHRSVYSLTPRPRPPRKRRSVSWLTGTISCLPLPKSIFIIFPIQPFIFSSLLVEFVEFFQVRAGQALFLVIRIDGLGLLVDVGEARRAEVAGDLLLQPRRRSELVQRQPLDDGHAGAHPQARG